MRILSFFLLITFAFADLTETGIAKMVQSDFTNAYETLTKAYKKDKSVRALYYMGYINYYEFKKYSLGIKQMREASKLGYQEATAKLAMIYYRIQKYKTAMKLFKQCAKQNHPKCMYNLAYAYEHGRGTKRDYAKARYWYAKLGL